MLKVSQLLKYLSELNPQNTPTRLAFHNFLRGLANPDEVLSKELIELFFSFCMDYAHWAANKSQLGTEIKYLLDNFNSYYQQKFDISEIRFPQNMQLIEIEQQNDQMDVVNCYVQSICGPDDKFRLLWDQNRRIVSIIMRENRSIEARVFDKKFTLRGGILEPLRKDLVLYYTPQLELSTQHIHRIDVAPYVTAQFTVQTQKITGALLRGYVFQKLQDFKAENIADLTRLQFAIKRLEQFFIDRRTDAFYQELVQQIERTQALIQQGDPEATKWSAMILGKAETALEYVYINDKFLSLMVRDLKHTLQLKPGSKQSGSQLLNQNEKLNEWQQQNPLKKLDLIN